MAPELHAPKGSRKRKRIVGRGNGSGNGTTAGRGTKGQNARAGGNVRPGFEGGQMPLYRRIARRGFSNHPFKVEYVTVNVEELQRAYKSGESVTEETLKARGLVGAKAKHIKLLGNGELKKKLKVSGIRMSGSAAKKIEAAGGSVDPASKPAGAEAAPVKQKAPKKQPAEEPSEDASSPEAAEEQSSASPESSAEEQESDSESTES